MGGGRERGISAEREEGISKGGMEGGRGRGRILQRKGRREGGREGITKGGMDVCKDEDRYGRYYKGSWEAGRVLQMEGGREGGGEGGRILRMKVLKPLYQLYLISMM